MVMSKGVWDEEIRMDKRWLFKIWNLILLHIRSLSLSSQVLQKKEEEE